MLWYIIIWRQNNRQILLFQTLAWTILFSPKEAAPSIHFDPNKAIKTTNSLINSAKNTPNTLYGQTVRHLMCASANYIATWSMLVSSNSTWTWALLFCAWGYYSFCFSVTRLKGNKDIYTKLKECWCVVHSAVYGERIKPRPRKFPMSSEL